MFGKVKSIVNIKPKDRRLVTLILGLFVLGTFFLALIQYNSARNIKLLVDGNSKLMAELRTSNHLRELEKDIIWTESRIRAAIATDDISHIEGINDKIADVKSYLDSLEGTSADLEERAAIERLGILATAKLRTKDDMIRDYNISGKMDNLVPIENPRARVISNEVSELTRKIYLNRQKLMLSLSGSIEKSELQARLWGWVMVALLLISGAGCCIYIINHFLKQSNLIDMLDASEKKSREVAIIKENFMANMSHEIRTPLNSILGFSKLLKSKKLPSKEQEFVCAIQLAGETLLSITNDILELSKIQAGMMTIEKQPFNLKGLLDSVTNMFWERVNSERLKISIRISENVPNTIIGDPTKLTQILVNLIGNAVKFTSDGKIEISVDAEAKFDDRVEICLSVKDTGIGIEKSKLPLIFERFRQAEDSTTRNYGGTGLGLSIVHDLVKMHKGRIELTSELTKGSTFRVYISYDLVLDAEKVQVRPVDFFDVKGEIRRKILVVDDNQMNQSLMHHLLSNRGIDFQMATDAKEAIGFLKRENYNLVLLDIQMPGMDGYQLAEHIRNDLSLAVPIIAMSAHALAGERMKCLSYGMDEYLPKPIEEHRLDDYIQKYLGISIGTKHRDIDPVRERFEKYSLINLAYMREISGGNREYEINVTQQFISLVPLALKNLEEAAVVNDLNSINSIAHQLKSCIYMMGMETHLEGLLTDMEYAHEINNVSQMVNALERICGPALLEAKHFLNLISPEGMIELN